MSETVGVIGGGAWGTALAFVAAQAGREVTLWARDPAIVDQINANRVTPRLGGVRLPESITATGTLGDAAAAGIVLVAVPAQATRAVTRQIGPALREGTPTVLCAKGLEADTGLTMSQVVSETLPRAAIAVLSGPGFASDVASGLPTAVTIAAADHAMALNLCRALAGPAFRPYGETDITGVEIGGAIKNVLAIAAGIVTGRGLGASAQAAVIARGFAELRRLAVTLGAEQETMMGLSGLGDLVLTCTSGKSRNFAYGERIGRGEHGSENDALVEGAPTAIAARNLAKRVSVDMPITNAVAAILDRSMSIEAAIEALLSRPLKRERD